MKAVMQCIPNYSEGRDLHKVEMIVDCFRARAGVRLLDYSTDPDHNRCVITAIGEPDALRHAVVESVGAAVELIDMNFHVGEHPRIGSADVIPFIPMKNCTLEDADRVARAAAKEIADRYGLPVYLYAKSAAKCYRSDVSDIRLGQYEGLREKMCDPLWKPDLGPSLPHPTAGATIVGARMPVIYYNINLDTGNVETARKIARRIRNKDGGLRYVKAMGIYSGEKDCAQVTMNMMDYTGSALYSALELVRTEAQRYGVRITGSEIVGFVPMNALIDSAEYYLQLEDFSGDQILEMYELE